MGETFEVNGDSDWTNREEFRSGIDSGVTRREFLRLAAASSLAVAAAPRGLAEEAKGDMPQRTLGRTGEKVSAIGLGV